MIFLLEPDCNECIPKFVENGICECIENEDCSLTGIIPDGCYSCVYKQTFITDVFIACTSAPDTGKYENMKFCLKLL